MTSRSSPVVVLVREGEENSARTVAALAGISRPFVVAVLPKNASDEQVRASVERALAGPPARRVVEAALDVAEAAAPLLGPQGAAVAIGVRVVRAVLGLAGRKPGKRARRLWAHRAGRSR